MKSPYHGPICVNGWLRLFRTGVAASGGRAPRGGDQRSARIEAHAPLILGMVENTPDVTLGELRAALTEQGIGAGVATLL